jgi:hypothetical protein
MRIVAKYAGKCERCGGGFASGASIEWEKGKGSRHVACPAKPSPAPEKKSWKEPSREEAPVVLTRDCGPSKPDLDSEVGRSFRLGKRAGEHAEKVVTVVAQRRTWISEDGLSFGLSDDRGWSLTLYCRLAAADEIARVEADELAERERRAERARRAEDAKRAEQAEAERIEALLVGLSCADSFSYDVLKGASPAELVGEIGKETTVHRYVLATGEVVYVKHWHCYDDDRSWLYASRETVERSWAALAAQMKLTPERSAKWLAEYRGCSGTELHEFVVRNAEAA